MKKTYTPSKNDIERGWHLIDAQSKVLGKVASDVSKLLIGKHKATYTPNINVGDKVVVINAEKVAVTGKKLTDKSYKRYTGYPGGIKSESLGNLLQRRPEEVIRRAVKGMLPTNKLRKERLLNLYIYKGEEHPHHGQVK